MSNRRERVVIPRVANRLDEHIVRVQQLASVAHIADEMPADNRTLEDGTHAVRESDLVLLCDTTDGAVTLTLPPVAQFCTPDGITGRFLFVIKVNNGASRVTFNTASGDTIEGATSYSFGVNVYAARVLYAWRDPASATGNGVWYVGAAYN